MSRLRNVALWVILAAAGCSDVPEEVDVDAGVAVEQGDAGPSSGTDMNADLGADAAENNEPEPSHDRCSEEVVFVGSGGSLIEPTLRLASDDTALYVAWEEFLNDDSGSLVQGPLHLATIPKGSLAEVQPATIAAADLANILSTPEVAAADGDVWISWGSATGPEVEDRQILVTGQNLVPSTLVPQPAENFGVQGPIWWEGAAWVAAWGPPEPPDVEFQLYRLDGSEVRAGTVRLDVGVGPDPSTIRFVETTGGLAAVYELQDEPGGFIELIGDLALDGDGQKIADGALDGRVRADEQTLAIFAEDRVAENGTQVAVVVFDQTGGITVPLAAEAADDVVLHPVDVIVQDGAVTAYWVQVRFEGADGVMSLWRATVDSATLVNGPTELFEFDLLEDGHSDSAPPPGSPAYIAPVGDKVAVVYGVGRYAETSPNSFEYVSVDYYLRWLCDVTD